MILGPSHVPAVALELCLKPFSLLFASLLVPLSPFPRFVLPLILAVSWAHSQDQEADFRIRSVTRGDDDRLRFEVPSSTDYYYVLYHRRDIDDADAESPVAIHFGEPGRTILTEPLGIGPSDGYYRVKRHRRDDPADTDDDGRNDVEELSDTTGRLAPLNSAEPIDFGDGVTQIVDRQMFRDLS